MCHVIGVLFVKELGSKTRKSKRSYTLLTYANKQYICLNIMHSTEVWYTSILQLQVSAIPNNSAVDLVEGRMFLIRRVSNMLFLNQECGNTDENTESWPQHSGLNNTQSSCIILLVLQKMKTLSKFEEKKKDILRVNWGNNAIANSWYFPQGDFWGYRCMTWSYTLFVFLNSIIMLFHS